jgi:folate-dependent tRNA-U54 methylase TrmFO/GidA
MAPRDDTLKVEGVDNLFCGGEKAGLLVGHSEAICTGTLAGYNAVRAIKGEKPLPLPDSLAIGDAITYVREQMRTKKVCFKYIFGSVFFDRMKARGLYSVDVRNSEVGQGNVRCLRRRLMRALRLQHFTRTLARSSMRGLSPAVPR